MTLCDGRTRHSVFHGSCICISSLLPTQQDRERALPLQPSSPLDRPIDKLDQMAPDLNSLPPSHSQAASASASQESSGADSHNTISPLVTAASNQTGHLRRESSSPPNEPAAPHSSRLRPSGRLNTQETPSPPRVGEASSRRNSQLYLYRTSSQSQRDALSGSALPSPRSPVSASMASQGDPHHQRAPSLGELHQELEQEQEAQVVSGILSTLRLGLTYRS